jgi:hypothetical protein
MQQQQRRSVGLAVDETRHCDACTEPEVPDFGFHSFRVRAPLIYRQMGDVGFPAWD